MNNLGIEIAGLPEEIIFSAIKTAVGETSGVLNSYSIAYEFWQMTTFSRTSDEQYAWKNKIFNASYLGELFSEENLWESDQNAVKEEMTNSIIENLKLLIQEHKDELQIEDISSAIAYISTQVNRNLEIDFTYYDYADNVVQGIRTSVSESKLGKIVGDEADERTLETLAEHFPDYSTIYENKLEKVAYVSKEYLVSIFVDDDWSFDVSKMFPEFNEEEDIEEFLYSVDEQMLLEKVLAVEGYDCFEIAGKQVLVQFD